MTELEAWGQLRVELAEKVRDTCADLEKLKKDCLEVEQELKNLGVAIRFLDRVKPREEELIY